MLTCNTGNQRSSGPQLCGRSGGQRWRPASDKEAHWSPGPVQQGGLWVGVGGRLCGGRHVREEEGERGGCSSTLALKEGPASSYGGRFRQWQRLPQVVS